MTFTITCPCGCGEAVEARDAGFTATSVDVVACKRRRAQGVASVEMRKSVAYAAADAYSREEAAWEAFWRD